MEDSPSKFGGRGNVHHRIVDAVEHKNVPSISPHPDDRIAVAFQPDAPVQGDGITRNWECAQPKW